MIIYLHIDNNNNVFYVSAYIIDATYDKLYIV